MSRAGRWTRKLPGSYTPLAKNSCRSAIDPGADISKPTAAARTHVFRLGRQTIPSAPSVKATRSACQVSAVRGSAGPQ